MAVTYKDIGHCFSTKEGCMCSNNTTRADECLFIMCAAPTKLCPKFTISTVRLRWARYFITDTNTTFVSLEVMVDLHTINHEPFIILL